MRNLKRQPTLRRAFTLLELLMVIAIIGLLMTLSVAVMAGFTDQAREEATSATIQKIQKMMEQRISAFERAFRGSRRDAAMSLVRAHLEDPDGDGNKIDGIFGVSDVVVEILAKKALFRFEFPQRFVDRTLVNFGDSDVNVLGLPDSVYFGVLAPKVRADLGLPDTTALDDPAIQTQAAVLFARHASFSETESSELLYFALLHSGNYGAASIDADLFTDQEIQDLDGDGLPEFVDAWGQPLRFYRWPTRLIDIDAPYPFQPDLANLADPTDTRAILPAERAIANIVMKGLPPVPFALPNGGTPRDALMTDPDDPVGRLYAELERFDGSNGTGVFADEYNEVNYHTPDTFHAPLIISAGSDGRLGLYEPNNTANLGNLAAFPPNLDGNATPLEPSDLKLVQELLFDNITSRNKKAGGR
jgi:prepilin-type N-terminal cleavage/methylation domain-containing protein